MTMVGISFYLRGRLTNLRTEYPIHKTCTLTYVKLKLLYLGTKKSKYKEKAQQNLFKKSKMRNLKSQL